ncbi:MAG: polysaccharide deacetylase family protein [Roseiflexaceae bacterium]
MPIITYHAIGAGPPPVWTSPQMFDSHLAAFAAQGYRTVTLAALLDALRGGPPLPKRSLVLTFDDGYQSIYDYVWPRLRARGFGATVFLISDYCGRDNRWPGQPNTMPTAPLLTWEQIAELAADGCEFGAHTRTHPALPTLPPAMVEEEIVVSKDVICEHTGQAVRSFCYPYGAANPAVCTVVRRCFDGAVGTELGLARPGCDPFLLPRLDAFYLRPGMIRYLDGALVRQYLRVRQSLRTIRRRFTPDWTPSQDLGTRHG